MKTYHDYKNLVRSGAKAQVFLDLDLLNKNINDLNKTLGSMPVRIATKSIRCLELQKRLSSQFKTFKGWMTYSLEESLMLLDQGFDHILLAYPCMNEALLEKAISYLVQKKDFVFTIDHPEHFELYNKLGKKHNVQIPICLDIDLASHWGSFTFGVHRSSIHDLADFKHRMDLLKNSSNLVLHGLLGYEAQIAGVPDYKMNPSAIISLFKSKSLKHVKKLRSEVLNLTREMTKKKIFFNGGGSGSLKETSADAAIDEVTLGSALYSPHLFDHYQFFKYEPALFYSVPITRNPQMNIWTCHGGGFIASGATHSMKQPIPYLPTGASLLTNEGAGEVQTPIFYDGKENLKLGDPIFMRSAKAGEVLEHFDELSLIQNNQIKEVIKTYRGSGFCF